MCVTLQAVSAVDLLHRVTLTARLSTLDVLFSHTFPLSTDRRLEGRLTLSGNTERQQQIHLHV